MITAKAVKKKIQKKFGSFTRFCTLAKIDRYEFQKFFARLSKKETPERLKYLAELESKCDSISEDKTISSDITSDLRGKIEKAIDKLGGVIKFCETNKEFNKISLYQIIAGQRIRKSKKVVNLLIKLNLV